MIHRVLDIRHLNKIFIVFCFFLAGCEENIVEEQDFQIPQNNTEELAKIKKPLENAWYEKINITISKDANIVEILKGIANKFNLKIIFNIKQHENINYSAKDKPLIEVLSDICDILNWKLQIKGRNGKISDDATYMHTYYVPFLIGERVGASDSSFSGTPGKQSDKGSSINIGSSGSLSSAVNLNPFEELRKNLEIIAETKESENENEKTEKVLKFSIHKQAGLLTIIAKQKVHKMIVKYLNLLSKQMRNQILIEARIYEVELYEQFETGIDWAKLLTIPFAKEGFPLLGSMSENGALNINIFNHDPSKPFNQLEGSIISFLRRFGKVHSISNPRVMIANNNIAIFKVVDNRVFFKLTQNERQSYSHNSRNNNIPDISSTISSEIHTIPVGIILLVQPSIDSNGRITISLHPTISEVHQEIEDPALAIMANNAKIPISSKIPIVKTRELDTVFTTEENKTAIIGGLLYSKKSDTESGLPLSWFGGKKAKLSEKKEIVIAIKAKIIYSQENYDELVFVE